MGGVEALVAERPADLVDPVDAADHRLLQVELERDPQQHLLVERVEVGAERPRGRAAVGQLQHRGLDLDEALLVERRAQRPQHGGLGAHHVARLGPHDHVDVAQPHPRLVVERRCSLGSGRSALAAIVQRVACTDSSPRRLVTTSPVDPEEVADVDQRLERPRALLADVGQREHHLQLGAVALAQPGEAELAGVALEDHPAGDRDDGRRCGCPAPASCGVVRVADLAQRVGARHRRAGTPPTPSSSSRWRFSRRTRICSGRSSRRGRRALSRRSA